MREAVYMNDTLGAWTGIAPHFMQVRHSKRDTVREAVYMNDSLGQWTGIVPEEVFHTSCRC